MTRFLPSLPALRSFEAASRHLSFTRAATELDITPTAISHQINNLEAGLGIKLFVREARQVRLTEAGHKFLRSARTILAEIATATDVANNPQRSDILTVYCVGTFSIKCLIPHLGSFRKRHPEIVVRLRTLLPFQTSFYLDADISILYGTGDWPNLALYRIDEEEVFPVCSPTLLAKKPRLRRPEDLRHQVIIRTASPFIQRDDWPIWLKKAGIDNPAFAGEISCDFLYPTFQAAIEGLGVAMGRSTVVREDIAAGKLIEPFSIRVPSSTTYYLAISPERERLPKVQVFRDWALAALRRTMSSDSRLPTEQSSGPLAVAQRHCGP